MLAVHLSLNSLYLWPLVLVAAPSAKKSLKLTFSKAKDDFSHLSVTDFIIIQLIMALNFLYCVDVPLTFFPFTFLAVKWHVAYYFIQCRCLKLQVSMFPIGCSLQKLSKFNQLPVMYFMLS